MGLMDFLADTIQAAAGSAKGGDLSGLINGVLFGNNSMNDAQKLAEEIAARPKPGKLCFKECPVNDHRCEGCLAKQQEILNSLKDLQELENTIKNAKERPTPAASAPSKCSLCGAPFEKEAKFCPYCGTPYPSDALMGDIPETDFERDKLLLEKTAATFALYSALFKENMGYRAESEKLPPMVRNMIKMSRPLAEKNMVMTPDQIREGAQLNGVSYIAYISGVMAGTYKTIPALNMDKQKEELNRRSAEMTRQSQERNAQMLANQRAREQQAKQENAQRQAQMAAMRTPKYIGGASQVGYCCGNCIHYMPYSNECANNHFKHPSGAGDYCNDHRSKY